MNKHSNGTVSMYLCIKHEGFQLPFSLTKLVCFCLLFGTFIYLQAEPVRAQELLPEPKAWVSVWEADGKGPRGTRPQWCRSLRDPLPSRRLPLWRPPTKPPGRRQLRQQSLGTWKQQMVVAKGIRSGWIDVYPSILGFKNCCFRSKIGRGRQE